MKRYMTYFQKKLSEHAKCVQKIKLHEIVLRLDKNVKTCIFSHRLSRR